MVLMGIVMIGKFSRKLYLSLFRSFPALWLGYSLLYFTP